MPKQNKKANMQRREKRPTQRLAAVSAFMQANMQALAALAWVGFQQEGRGFVLVAFDETHGLDASYIGERDELWPTLAPNFPELAELMASYDPALQMAVVRRVPGYQDMAVIAPDVPPPVAFARNGGTLS